MLNFNINSVQTPCYVVDESLLIKNLEILKSVSDASGCKILLAQKAFSMFYYYPLVKKYLYGSAASGYFEARLGHEEMGGETHVFSAAYRPDEMDLILAICDHIVFNSVSEWNKYKEKAIASKKSCGIRINPEFSTQEHAIYDPCSPGSRMGVTLETLENADLEGISGFHFHTLCEQNFEPLKETLNVVEKKFSKYFSKLKWINFGGGHHITRKDYDVNGLIDCIANFKNKYGLDVYLEPGEAIALNAGFLVSSVLDITKNKVNNAILDASAACHMPDVLEVPYRPNIINSGLPDEKKYTYTFGGPTCLAGDIIGSYSFDNPLKTGDRVVFCDMAIYSMVKNNTFNGMGLPAIYAVTVNGELNKVKTFTYSDFKNRLS